MMQTGVNIHTGQGFAPGGGQMNGNPVMAPPQQGAPGGMQGAPVMGPGQDLNLNRLGQIRGQGNWGPGTQWYMNHRMGMQGGPIMAGGPGGMGQLPPGLLSALGPLGGGQMQGGPGFGPRSHDPMPGMGGGQMQGGPVMAGAQPFGPQQGPGGMQPQQWQQLLQQLNQGGPGQNYGPAQRYAM